MQTATQWRERTKPQRRAQLRARHEALRDLKEMEIQFDFLRPCETTFNPLIGGWDESAYSRFLEGDYFTLKCKSISGKLIWIAIAKHSKRQYRVIMKK